MFTRIFYFAAISRFVFCENITIITESNDGRHVGITPNIERYYTDLSMYGIFPGNEGVLNFHLMACDHGYVLLSASVDMKNPTEFYEIVFGGDWNMMDKIRRRYENGKVVMLGQNRTRSLNCQEYRSLFIDWSINGQILFGRVPSVSVKITDPNPIQIKALGIRKALGKTGSWIFERKDCPNNTYGYHCEKICGHCQSRDLCDRINGTCKNGCESGWMGERCDEVDTSLCRCSCEFKARLEYWSRKNLPNRTREEWLEILTPKLEAIQQELKINNYNLSMNRRRRTSALDDRKSAKQIGIVGAVFLVSVIGLVICIDITALQKRAGRDGTSAKVRPAMR